MAGETSEQPITIPGNVDVPNPKFFDVEQAKDFISKYRQPVNYQDILTPSIKVLFLGEAHETSAPKDEVSANIQTLKDLGITHIALEMFTSDKQELVDNFLQEEESRGIARFRLLAMLETTGWSHTPMATREYMKVADSAKQAGLGILAIDKPLGKDIDFTTEEAMVERNEHWRDILVDFFGKNPQAKVAVLCGAHHCRNNMPFPSVNSLLAAKDIESSNAIFVGGINTEEQDKLNETLDRTSKRREVKEKEEEPEMEELFERAAVATGSTKERFMLDLRSLGENRPADYFVHLPQTEMPGLLKYLLAK